MLIMLCGLPGAGKTTLARELETMRNAIRFCPDEWIARILADPGDVTERDRLRDPVEGLQWTLARQLLAKGVDVVLENGFWSREERGRYRGEAHEIGAAVELIYLDVDREELWARLSARNNASVERTFVVSRAELDEWWSVFEPPGPDESPVLVR